MPPLPSHSIQQHHVPRISLAAVCSSQARHAAGLHASHARPTPRSPRACEPSLSKLYWPPGTRLPYVRWKLRSAQAPPFSVAATTLQARVVHCGSDPGRRSPQACHARCPHTTTPPLPVLPPPWSGLASAGHGIRPCTQAAS